MIGGLSVSSWRRLVDVVLLALVLVCAVLVFNRSAQQLESRGDEWLYLYSSRYFANLFTNGGPANPEWADGYWTHLQPMMLSYALGAWLTVRGYDVFSLPRPRISTFYRNLYNLPVEPPPFELNRENFVIGPVPDRALLAEGRALMVAVATGVVLLVYMIGRVVAGPVAGLAAAAIVLGRPMFSHELVWIQTESVLMFFVLLALLLAVLGARYSEAGGVRVRWAIPLGVALGLALGTKATALLSLAAVGLWMVVVAVVAAARAVPGSALPDASRRTRLAFEAARGWALAIGIALGVFVLSNPHLYQNPIVHAGHLFGTRADALEDIVRRNPAAGFTGVAERIDFVVRGSLMGGSSLSAEASPPQRALGLGLVVLALAGVLALGLSAARAASGHADAVLVITVLTYFAGISTAISLAIPRYLVPSAVLGALVCGIGAAALIGAAVTAAARVPRLSRLVAQTRDRFEIGHV